MNKRFAIFGSCVTRDAFEVLRRHGGGHEVVIYLARTTINSCLARPMTLAALGVPAKPRFEERCVAADLGKTHITELRAKPFDYLIVDLIDERHPVLTVDGSLICHSVPLVNLARDSGLDLSRFASQKPHDPATVQATLENIPRFVAALSDVVDPRQIVLHEALWARRYRTADGTLRDFPDPAYIERCNRTLKAYYAAIRTACPALIPIRLPDDDVVADETHRWTLEPYHYADQYYERFLVLLDEAIGVLA